MCAAHSSPESNNQLQVSCRSIARCLSPHAHTPTHTESANQRSEKGHLCLPGLPGDEEEAVIGGIDPVGASLADHYATAGVSAAAVAAVMLQNKGNELQQPQVMQT